MATQHNFNGRIIKLPGSYSETKSGINNPPVQTTYGNVIIIDDNATNPYGGGAGIDGQGENGEGSVYGFDNIRDLREFVGGGVLWDLAAPLFKPFGSGSNGASKVYVVRALTTTQASYDLALTGGTITLKVKHEGLVGNGVEGVTDQLTQGFAITMEAGVVDSTKFRFKFWRGTYKGLDSEGNILDNLSQQDSAPKLITTSREVSTLTELKEWAAIDFDFGNNFDISADAITSDTIIAADLTTTSGNQLFAGATQTASVAAMQSTLDSIKKTDYTFTLSLDSEANIASANNLKQVFHLQNEARYQKYLIVGGGNDKNTFATQSIASAKVFNTTRVIVVHGGCLVEDGLRLRKKNSLYKAALVLGRTCGLEPQIPITFKGLAIAGEIHKMTDKERTVALDAGVLTTYFDSELNDGGLFAITQGINTLQNNSNVVNSDGTSHLVSVERIAASLNKSIEVNSKKKLLGNQSEGPNRSTLSTEIVKEWVENHLRTKEATPTVDNLIISWKDVTVTVEQDAYKIRYAFEPNFEVNKLFFTGLIIDPNIS